MKDTGLFASRGEEFNQGQRQGLITQSFCVMKFSLSIKEIEEASDIYIWREQKECPPARL